MIEKLNQGKPTLPSELSVKIHKTGPKARHLFMWAACTAIAEKYQQAERNDVAALLLQLRFIVEKNFFLDDIAWEDRERIHAAGRSLQSFYYGHKRISHYQSRWRCADMDIILCSGAALSVDSGVTPWVCQQPDLRYRWTDVGMTRLLYLADCWDCYAKSELTWADRFIGLPNFPTHSEYC